MLKPEAWATFLSIAFLVGLKSILIKTETIKLAIPSIRQIRNSKLIENDFNNKIPKDQWLIQEQDLVKIS